MFYEASRSRHATHRQQNRATLPLFEELLLDYGTRKRSYGAEIIYLDKAARKRLSDAVGGKRGMRVLERYCNQFLVVGDDGRVITTGYRTKRIRR